MTISMCADNGSDWAVFATDRWNNRRLKISLLEKNMIYENGKNENKKKYPTETLMRSAPGHPT